MPNSEKQILESLDCFDFRLRPFIPYLLQDLWEIGSSSKKILNVIKRNNLDKQRLKILDIGCGKGAISIPIAKELNAEVFGVDGMPEFIEEAENKAKTFNVEKLCEFVCGDAQEIIDGLTGFNLAMLASVGPILGNVLQSLNRLEKCLCGGGYIILDDCYLPDNTFSNYSRCLMETEFFKQINESNYNVVDKLIQSTDDTAEIDNFIYEKIEIRAKELSEKYPDKKGLFESYLSAQSKENYALENELQGITILLKKK